MTHDEMIEVIAADKAGRRIECRFKVPKGSTLIEWEPVTNPVWSFDSTEYRIAPEHKKPRTIYVNEYRDGRNLCAHPLEKIAKSTVGSKATRVAVPYREVTDHDAPSVPEGWQLVPKKINCVFILSAKDDGDDFRISNYKWGLILGSLPKYKGEQS